MGVTIHYRMIADDPRTVIAALKVVKEGAARAGYRYQEFRGEGIAFMEVGPIFESRESAAKWLKEALLSIRHGDRNDQRQGVDSKRGARGGSGSDGSSLRWQARSGGRKLVSEE